MLNSNFLNSMMNFSLKLVAGIFLLLAISCKDRHLFSDRTEWQTVIQDFENKQKALPEGNLFEIFNTSLTSEEREALLFLYAYMPIGDITDYGGAYYLMNVQYALQARKEMPWGKTIPEREFRHFVLPIRVNNENLDESRKIFYEELKDRVKNLTLYDAILEVNHWCHEKVIYTPSDSRTSSPLASVKTAYGRCGEESTFLVAALRSIGIPARQVYTPRWAHTDDNHAWVEAWVDGQWHFLGACEPEPVLDLGWFNAPASRGMLMHTKVFGRYTGPEEVMSQTESYTEINVIGNYAPSTTACITIVNTDNIPVENAKVDFKIYNYAEFYTVASKQTDKQGQTSLSAGKGDMLIWATDGKKFGYGKLGFAQDSAIQIKLDKQAGEITSLDLDIIPPVENAKPIKVTPEQRRENDRKISQEDSIRNTYTATFMTPGRVVPLTHKLGLEAEPLTSLLIAGRGNYDQLISFLEKTPDTLRTRALQLLQVISAKDLRDTPESVLTDHLQNTPASENPLYEAYILNPRIANEMLTSYKTFFQQAIPAELAREIRENPGIWTQWCANNITLKDDLNPQNIPMMPQGVWKARRADRHSRDIFYVAVLRSLGVAARIDEVTGKTQYAGREGIWQDVNFTASVPEKQPQGKLIARYRPVKTLANPLYYTHFTLSKYENGTFKLLTFPEDNSSNWENLLKEPLALDTGYYMLVTGTRLASGGVLSQASFFNICPDKTTETELRMRENPDEVKVIGSLNSEALFLPKGETVPQSILKTTGRGYFIVGILGAGQEPSNHALRDIAALKNDFEAWGRSMIFLFPNEQQLQNFRPGEFPDLPATITFGVDQDNTVRQMISENMKLSHGNLPIFVIADTFNRIVFISQGYTIGLGEQLMKTIHKL